MKKLLLMIGIVCLTLSMSLPAAKAQGMGKGQGPGKGAPAKGWYCPWAYGASQDRGWICPWGGTGDIKPPESIQQGKPLTEGEARSLVTQSLKSTNNPNLKVGKISDEGEFFLAEVITKEGSLVDKVQVGKMTGWLRSIY